VIVDQRKVSISEVIHKLDSVRLERPKGTHYTHGFLQFLATRIKRQRGSFLTAEEFLLEVELAFSAIKQLAEDPLDLDHAAHRSHEPRSEEELQFLRVHEIDRIHSTRMFIRLDLPEAFRMVLPADFAAEVEQISTEVHEQLRQMQKEGKNA
jgi:hypothetical protein